MKTRVLGLSLLITHLAAGAIEQFQYAPAPADNPLKGLVPYAGQGKELFPHSMEFSYLPLSKVVIGDKQYDWTALETLLDEVAGRGHQSIFRFYLEYPSGEPGVPEYLLKEGLVQHEWKEQDKTHLTPDYKNKDLQRCIIDFIEEIGDRYDGDPRIGFITAGLLGKWGEWHNHPQNKWWADRSLQKKVLNAYAKAFEVTPILLRYPTAAGDEDRVKNADRKFGYHDDSFSWATLDTGPDSKSWHFMPQMKRAGVLDHWKRFPIGGEIRPEAWGKVFDAEPADDRIQDFITCVEQTHVTWLMDSGMFSREHWTQDRHDRALKKVRRMGYELHITEVAHNLFGNKLRITIQVENRGVAPFYYEWSVELALFAPDGVIHAKKITKITPCHILPSEPPVEWKEIMDLSGINSGTYRIILRVPNPLKDALPLRFANETQDKDLSGWVSLNAIKIP